MDAPRLKRSINLPFLVLYGLGTMVGGGFYALLGKVSAQAGMATPLALALSGLLALLCGFSFAELSARYPFSAGEAHYVRESFGRIGPSTLVGWLVILTGIVSAATLAVATVGFLQDVVSIDTRLGILLLVLAMGLVAGWGVGQSVGIVTFITILEVGALVYVFLLNADALTQLPQRWPEMLPAIEAPNGSGTCIGVFAGAFLAFYAFIGFEDMVNMAEEVKDVRRNLPLAILISISITTLLYLSVATVAVLSIDIDRLAGSSTPIAELVRGDGWLSGTGIWVVSLLTGLNGALVQIIMAARVAYGMASRNQAPDWLAAVHPRTRTPLRATAAMTLVILLLALFFPLTTLAKTTSAIILAVFATVNLALWTLKRRDPAPVGEGPRFPPWVPLLGFSASSLVLVFQGWLLVSGG